MDKRVNNRLGQIVGMLTVVAFHRGGGNGKPAEWLCKCECGNLVVKKADALRDAKFLHCGCLWLNKARSKGRSH